MANLASCHASEGWIRKERNKVAQAKVYLAFFKSTSETLFFWCKHYSYKCFAVQALSVRPDPTIQPDQATLCLWRVSAVAWVILKQIKEAREKSQGRMQMRSMGHGCVPTDSAQLGRCFLVPVSSCVPQMPAAAYMGIWDPNNNEVSPLFCGSRSLGRQKGLTAPCSLALL